MSGYQSSAYNPGSYAEPSAGNTENPFTHQEPEPANYSHQPVQQQQEYAPEPYLSTSNFSGNISAQNFKDPKVLLRIAEWFFSLIAFSAAAGAIDYFGKAPSFHSFFMFVGVLAFIFDMVFFLLYIIPVPHQLERFVPPAEFGITALWAFFWFAASTAYAVGVNDVIGQSLNRAHAAAVFGFFSFFLWIASAAFAFRRLRGLDTGVPSTYSDL